MSNSHFRLLILSGLILGCLIFALVSLASTLLHSAALVEPGSQNVEAAIIPLGNEGYSISGRVTDSAGAPMQGVTISIGSSLVHRSVTTDPANGQYKVAGLPPDVYSVTPSKSGYAFQPISRTLVLTQDVTGQDFTGLVLTYTISGRVADGNDNPISNVTISAGGILITSTNANGTYQFVGLVSGTYTITPSLSDYTFSPPRRVIQVPPDATGQNFTGAAITYAISGTVSDSSSIPISGVTISAGNGRTTTTDSAGNYLLGGLPRGTYVITAAKPGYGFTPPSITVSTPPNASGNNFTGTALAYSIAGRIVDANDNPLADVAVSAGGSHTTTTNPDGRYVLDGLLAGTYAVTPSAPGLVLTPTSRMVTVPPSATAQDYKKVNPASHMIYLPLTLRAYSPPCDAYEPNDSRFAPWGPLVPGTTYQAKLCAPWPEEDNYYFDVQNAVQDVKLHLYLPNTLVWSGDPNVGTDLYLYSTADLQTPLTGSDGPIMSTDYVLNARLPAGRYVIRLYSVGVSDSINEYRLRVEFASAPTQAQTPPGW